MKFLLSESENSFDGRYFGPVQHMKIEGLSWPLFVNQHHNIENEDGEEGRKGFKAR